MRGSQVQGLSAPPTPLRASSVGCSRQVIPFPRAVVQEPEHMAEIYEWRSPVQPRSGLARRFINGLSSSSLDLQALSVPLVHSRMWEIQNLPLHLVVGVWQREVM